MAEQKAVHVALVRCQTDVAPFMTTYACREILGSAMELGWRPRREA